MNDLGKGSEERFRAAFDAHFRELLAYSARRVSDPADAADVVAETFLVAWRKIDALPHGGEARPWLYAVCRHVLSDQRRGGGRRRQLADRLRQHVQEADVADPGASLAATQTVRAAMDGLDEDDRELLRLTAWEGLSPSEAAIVLAISPATARTRLHRARGRVRRTLVAAGFVDAENDDSSPVPATTPVMTATGDPALPQASQGLA